MTTKKIVFVITIFSVLVCLSLPGFDKETVKEKGTALDKGVKKIQIDEKEYTLGDEAFSVEVMVGDEIEATVNGNVMKNITKS